MRSILKVVLSAMVVTTLALASTAAMAAEQTTCPVMGGEITKDLYADHNGKRVYFCCQMCVPQFKKNPQAFIKKLESKGVKLEVVSK